MTDRKYEELICRLDAMQDRIIELEGLQRRFNNDLTFDIQHLNARLCGISRTLEKEKREKRK